jgi:SAM-dependent methyltransferase
MQNSQPHWEQFSRERLTRIFSENKEIIDIGGSLRLYQEKGNIQSGTYEWLRPLVEKVSYKVLDPVPDYHPDIVGDIHALPFPDSSVEAYLCIAVLEHIEDPHQAAREMYRTLKPGGMCFVYAPFLYPYHAERGYYGDFFRYTEEAFRHIFKQFKTIEIVNVRGAFETWIYLSPLRRIPGIQRIARVIDHMTGKSQSRQTSGHNVFLIK